jgi:FG-GAP-like repeat
MDDALKGSKGGQGPLDQTVMWRGPRVRQLAKRAILFSLLCCAVLGTPGGRQWGPSYMGRAWLAHGTASGPRGPLLCSTCASSVGLKQPQFFARRDYPSAPGYVAVADVNGDGIPDVVSMSSTGVHTLLGKGDGTFRVGPTTNPGGVLGFFELVPIDLNGDGKVDLIIAQGGGIEVCFGNGDGTFQPAILYVPGSGLGQGGGQYVIVDDFNGDGIPDVAITGGGGVFLYTGRGGGVFNPGVLIPVIGGTFNGNLTAADFNGDGILA